MKPLFSTKKLFIWLCACSATETDSQLNRLIYIIFTLIAIITNMTCMLSSAVYFVNFVFIDLEDSLYALYQFSGILGATSAIIITIAKRQEITNTFKNLEDICKESKLFYINKLIIIYLRNVLFSIFNIQTRMRARPDFCNERVTKANSYSNHSFRLLAASAYILR